MNATPRGKNIVICADGTGNTAIKGRGTNVFKLYEAVDQTGRARPGTTLQVAIYHDGVGTEQWKWYRLLTGATGLGLSRNIKQLYGELARVYAPGDKIFLFGFSRGAFTVRTLAGLIHACGILDLGRYRTNEELAAAADSAYAEYRKRYATWLGERLHGKRPIDAPALRRRFSVTIPEFEDPARGTLIEFLGVWDTVDAVGLPIRAADFVDRVIYPFKFPDRMLNTSVGHACHALALDEERESFAPVLWDEKGETKTAGPGRIEQVWFAGVHSNVGGGYPRQGMSLVALDWMMSKAEAHGLRFVDADRLAYRHHADVGDKLYDSRGGMGVFYRWRPRDVPRLCADNGVRPRVHRSVFERIARNTEAYAPGSVPPDPEVVSVSQPAAAVAVGTLVRNQHAGGPALLEREAALERVGVWSYWLFIWAMLTMGGLVVREYTAGVSRNTADWLEVAQNLLSTVVSASWLGVGASVVWHYPWLAAWLAVTLALALWVDRQLDRRYSRFWQDDGLRLSLRKALGLG